MPLNFIPNQPILFDDPLFAGQSCLNSDVRQYAQLAQPGDTTCIQWKNPPVNELFNCAMAEQPNVITNGQFDSLLTGWQEIDLGTGVITAPTLYSYTGTGAVTIGGVKPLFTTTGITVGNLVMISFYVTDPTVQTAAGIGDASTNTWNFLSSVNINYDGRATVVLYALAGSDIAFFANGIQEFRDVQVRDINTSYCFTPNGDSFYWSYVESLNGFEFILSDGNPHPLTLNGNISNGSTYRITFKVKGLPVDPLNYLYIADGTTNDIIVTADDNKEYSFFYTHTALTTSITLNVSDWTNMVGTIIYDLKFEEFSYDYSTSIIFPDGECASIAYDSSSILNPIQFYEDRIIWCFDWSTLVSCGTGDQLYSDCYRIKIVDNETENEFLSYTVINYKLEGHECSVMMVGDNNGIAFDFFFNDPSTTVDFTLRQRLRLLQFNPSYPAKVEEYLYSNGNHVRTYAETAKFRTAWFDYVDEPTHDVIRLQLLSDTLTIDGAEFFCRAEDYEPEWSANGKYNLAQSRVVLKAVTEKSLFNKSC
jgi:hypothetical protein